MTDRDEHAATGEPPVRRHQLPAADHVEDRGHRLGELAWRAEHVVGAQRVRPVPLCHVTSRRDHFRATRRGELHRKPADPARGTRDEHPPAQDRTHRRSAHSAVVAATGIVLKRPKSVRVGASIPRCPPKTQQAQ
nr:hypothetical protein [Amycolatopsis australiensis]